MMIMKAPASNNEVQPTELPDSGNKFMKSHRAPNLISVDQTTFISQAALIREEGRRTRTAIWIAALVVIVCVIFTPFLFAAAPVVAGLVGAIFIAAFVGAILGKLMSRRKERRLMSEITHHNDRVVPILSATKAPQAEEKS
jgi:hypothetical protein